MENSVSAKKPHVLVIPLSGHSHSAPLLGLATALARKGVIVTFASHEAETSDLTSGGSQVPDNFHLLALPQYEVAAKMPNDIAASLEKSFEPFAEKLIRDQLAGIDGPTCILSDTLIYWAQNLASRLQIPSFLFVASAALVARFDQAVEELFVEGKFKVNADDQTLEMVDGKIDIPGLPPLGFNELSRLLRRTPRAYRRRAREVAETAGILVNTFYDLEVPVIDTFRKPPESTVTRAQKIYPVGPVFLGKSAVTVTNSSVNGGLQVPQDKCLDWLDSQPASSVLYISFGSLFSPSREHTKELALGLERSKQRFILVLPQPKADADFLPPGWEGRVSELGFIVKGWAPQIEILSHPSTGGFLTHCGWNSCLEGVSYGVPMIGWPNSADQHLNCRYLVDELKVATEVRRGADGNVDQKEVERVVRLLMVGEEGKTIRARAKDLKMKAAAAVAADGSSSQALQEFVEDINMFKFVEDTKI